MIDRLLYSHEADYIFTDLQTYKQVIDGVLCWSLRRLCNIFEISFFDAQNDLLRMEKSFEKIRSDSYFNISEYKIIKNSHPGEIVKTIEVEAYVDKFATETEDYLLTPYALYYMAETFLYHETDIQRLKDFVMLEASNRFSTLEVEKTDEI